MDYVAGLKAPSGRNFYNTRTGEVLPADAESPVGKVRREGRKYRANIFGRADLAKSFTSEAGAVMHILLLH